ncbi:MAG: molybdopterin biosynthesis protein [Proteobacteria bacterium]|nr:molybdopterin biosynthesis protein [Pseudomonadota bacterium]MBU1139903.1 molybdopterin biosynthesis protein [Pseudomonadota bacterium]MBU1233945.1 molybdopterin biosynthesis protein [Pseudomonadota bacterium]MBU1420766.1 molybdopterin biosynthesis protein [Pseudomonadota bacterium]MBU1456664.1 molybdopterin biosynthesis protein [Pseudomonadota bacterium]
MKQKDIYVTNMPLPQAMATWQEALHKINFFTAGATRTMAVDKALGQITGTPVFAAHSSPPFNAAAMDGIAVHFTDLAAASEASPIRLAADRFHPVNTGNALPHDFDAVVMIEDVHYLSADEVELSIPATPWQHVRTIGEDIVTTELILPEGHKIRPIDQGAMLATGVTEVLVREAPRMTVIPTGSELIQPGETPAPGRIIEFNSRILAGYLNEWGAVAQRAAPVSDDKDKLRQAIGDAVKNNDIVIINAGASAGTRDYTSTILAELGEVVVHGVAIKPGKPVILAIVDNTPVIGLPGYPVSAILTMRLFVQDMVYAFMGMQKPASQWVTARMSRPMHSAMGVDEFVRITLGQVGEELMATPAGKGAGAVMSLVRADGILTLPAGSEGVGAGEEVQVELLRPLVDVQSTLVAIGSHDNIIDVLANQLHKERPVIRISSAHVGSMGGIMAIRRGEAHLAGSHLLDAESGEYNISFIKRFLPETPLQLINLCYRQQGLIVAKGNPLGIKGFQDIADRNLTFINRQNGAGTRLLTDKTLQDLGLPATAISGYEHEEYTHMSVAAAIACGSVDSGMGILAAANALGLDFVPVAEERYDLIIPKQFLNDKKILTLLKLIRSSAEFQILVQGLGGYSLRDCGKLMYEQ